MKQATDETAVATARLLWAACRPQPDVRAVVDAIDSGADLGPAVRAAIAQGAGPLLWVGLGEAGVADRLGEAGDLLRREFEIRRAQAALLLPRAIRTAVRPLVDAGLEPLVFKGPTLAARYPEPGLRPMDDLDIVLPRRDHRAGVAALVATGWQPYEGRDWKLYDSLLFHPSIPDLPVELHYGLDVWRERQNRLTAKELWRFRRPIDCFGTPAFALPPEIELVALASHAGKPYHQFERLMWSIDLAVVVAAAPTFDWELVARHARSYRCATVLAVGLRQACRLGAVVPDELLRLPSSRSRTRALAPLLSELWPIAGESQGLRFGLTDSRSRELVLAVGDITSGGVRGLPQAGGRFVARGFQTLRRWR